MSNPCTAAASRARLHRPPLAHSPIPALQGDPMGQDQLAKPVPAAPVQGLGGTNTGLLPGRCCAGPLYLMRAARTEGPQTPSEATGTTGAGGHRRPGGRGHLPRQPRQRCLPAPPHCCDDGTRHHCCSPRSRITAAAALCPAQPITEPAGWQPAEHEYRPCRGSRRGPGRASALLSSACGAGHMWDSTPLPPAGAKQDTWPGVAAAAAPAAAAAAAAQHPTPGGVCGMGSGPQRPGYCLYDGCGHG